MGGECYDAIVSLFGRFLPKGHIMPANLYQSDKILHVLKMPYEKIDAYENGCALFRLQYADLNYCPICKSSRYVEVDNSMGEKSLTKIPINVLRYMPIIPRLQCLFMVEETVRQMTWHKLGKRTERDADGNLMMVHTLDGAAWKHFDALHDEKAADPRNPRVAVSMDGYRRFLDPRHKFRKDKKNFIKGRDVKNSAPPALTGQQTLD
mgnify:CR=1 FL=1